jgi:hypothetical protein
MNPQILSGDSEGKHEDAKTQRHKGHKEDENEETMERGADAGILSSIESFFVLFVSLRLCGMSFPVGG